MRSALAFIFLALAALPARAEMSPEQIQSTVGVAGPLSSSVRVFTTLRDPTAIPGDNAYLVPTFSIFVGNTPLTNSSPDPLLARFFSATGIASTTKAVAITVEFTGMPEVPLLIVEKTSNKYKQTSVANLSLTPSLQYPAAGRTMTIRYRYSSSFDSTLPTKMFTYASTISSLVSGAPLGLLAKPEIDQVGQSLQSVLTSTFSIAQELTFQIGISKPLATYVDRLEVSYYDHPASSSNAQEIVRLVASLATTPSLFTDPDAAGKYTNADSSAILNKVLGKQSVYDYLKSQTNDFIVMRAGGATAQQYANGCEAIRDPINRLGLTSNDVSLVYWAATSSVEPSNSSMCPHSEEKKRMKSLGLPSISGDTGASPPTNIYENYHKPALEKLARLFIYGGSSSEVAGDSVGYQQFAEMIPGVALAENNFYATGAFDKVLGNLRATSFTDWGLIPGTTSDYVVKTVIVGGKKYNIQVRLELVQTSSGASEAKVARVTRLVAMQVGLS